MASFDVGDTWSPQIKVTDNGVPADPQTLALKVRTPAGIIMTYAYPAVPIVRDSVGVYHADIVLTVPGTWVAQWETSSPAQVQGASILVAPAPIDQVPSSLSLDVLKRRLEITRANNDDDLGLMLRGVIAFAAGPTATNRQLTPLVATTYTGRVRNGRIRVPDARTVTAVTVGGVAVTVYELTSDHGYITHVVIDPDASLPTGWASEWPIGNRSRLVASVTGTFGMDPIPDDLADAIYTHAARNWKEKEAMYADQVALDEGGAVVNYFRSMPPRVKAVYEDYRMASDWTALA